MRSPPPGDGWTDGASGLLQICDFDLGFHGKWIAELAGEGDVLLIDPAAGLIQPELVQQILDRADQRGDLDVIFSQAAPGLSGAGGEEFAAHAARGGGSASGEAVALSPRTAEPRSDCR